MFRNYLSAALGNLLRSKLHAAINLLGLALGLATAILIGLYVRDEITFERFLPDYQDLYRVQTVDTDAQGKITTNPSTPHSEGPALKDSFPEVAGVTRLMGGTYGVRHGTVEAIERMTAADPDFFTMFGYRLVRGEAATALAAPDTIALSRTMAMKYFGTVECIGQTLELDRKATLQVEAVYEDFPSNTTLYGTNFILSGLASISSLAKADKLPPLEPGNFSTDSLTFVRLKHGAPVASVDDGLPALVNRLYPQTRPGAALRNGFLAPIASLHLHARDLGDYRAGGDITTVYAISATGVLVLLVAGINFVNLVTARAARRALEVGVRKAAGATRHQLMAQFMTESIAYHYFGTLGSAISARSLSQ
jgi:putative ABC transport system permease protein